MGKRIMGYWDCPYCGPNGDSRERVECSECGCPRDESVSSDMKVTEFASGEKEEKASKTHPSVRTRSGIKKILITVSVQVALVFCALITYLSIPKHNPAMITSLSWTRTITIEQIFLCEKNGWLILKSNLEEIHNYVIDHYEKVAVEKSEQVIDHYKTNYKYLETGDGSLEEYSYEAPVYATKSHFESEEMPVYVDVPIYQANFSNALWRWIESRKVTESGEGHTARWPDFTLSINEREGDRKSIYTVTFTNEKGKTYTYKMGESDWYDVNVGDIFDLSKLDKRFKKR